MPSFRLPSLGHAGVAQEFEIIGADLRILVRLRHLVLRQRQRRVFPQRRFHVSAGLFRNESSNGKLRDELLNGENFYTLGEAKVLIESWRRHCNSIRPHSSLGWRTPAESALASGQACLP